MKFSDLGLNDWLVGKCESLNFTEPTPIQKLAVPIVIKGSDLIGCAETGTGKTAAFLLPIIQKLASQFKPGVRVLIVAPTRELVLQIEAAYKQFASKKYPCVSLIGGASLNRQTDALRRGVSVVIATPGRLIDHIERGNVNLAKIEFLTLDEADRMLDMGFCPPSKKFWRAGQTTPGRRGIGDGTGRPGRRLTQTSVQFRRQAMPLKKGSSQSAVSQNIETLVDDYKVTKTSTSYLTKPKSSTAARRI